MSAKQQYKRAYSLVRYCKLILGNPDNRMLISVFNGEDIDPAIGNRALKSYRNTRN